MKRKTALFLPFLLIILFVPPGCHAQGKKTASPKDYDLTRPEVIKLPKDVDQISGIAYDGKDNAVFAIDDDHGNLYKIPLTKNPQIEKWDFGSSKDFEDVVLLNGTIYALNSKGKLVYFPVSFPVDTVEKAELGLGGQNEFESLYADPSGNRLVLLCKACAKDKKHENSAYAFDVTSRSFGRQPVFSVQKKEIEKRLGEKISRFKPSAANVNPLTGEVFIVSSINKLLVITDTNGVVKDVYKLDPKIFKQPEGLCFTPKGDLLISNEAASEGKADILIFRHL